MAVKNREHYTVHRWTNPNLQHLVDWNTGATDEDIRAFYVQVGKELRKQRTAKHWTQKQLSELTGYSVQRISRVENGREEILVEELLRLSAALGKRAIVVLEEPE